MDNVGVKVQVSGFSPELKAELKGMMKQKILEKYRTLPLPEQEYMVTGVLTDEFIKQLCVKCLCYYKEFKETDSVCELTEQDCVNIYFNRA